MGAHIVGAFERVGEVTIVGRDEAVEPGFEVVARARVGVVHEDEAAAGVWTKDAGDAGADAASAHELGDFARDFVGVRAAVTAGEGVLKRGHDVETDG